MKCPHCGSEVIAGLGDVTESHYDNAAAAQPSLPVIAKFDANAVVQTFVLHEKATQAAAATPLPTFRTPLRNRLEFCE